MDDDFNINLRWVIKTHARFHGEAFPRNRLMLRAERTRRTDFRNLPILGDPWMAPVFRLPVSRNTDWAVFLEEMRGWFSHLELDLTFAQGRKTNRWPTRYWIVMGKRGDRTALEPVAVWAKMRLA